MSAVYRNKNFDLPINTHKIITQRFDVCQVLIQFQLACAIY